MYWRTRHGDRLRGSRTSWPVTASPGAAQAEVPVLSPKTVTTATSAALTAWGPAVRAVPITHTCTRWPDHPFRCTLGTSAGPASLRARHTPCHPRVNPAFLDHLGTGGQSRAAGIRGVRALVLHGASPLSGETPRRYFRHSCAPAARRVRGQ